jgi:Mg-chelatase subunit ChlD
MNPSLSSSRKEKGIAILLTGVLLVLIIPIVGLAIDAGVLYALKAKLVLATDAAALAAARSLNLGLTLAAQEAAATGRAVTVYNANFPANAFYTKNNTVSASVAENAYKTRTVTVNGQLDAPTYFMRFLGFDHTTVKASGTASRRDVNLVLVLDRSSSMSNANSCAIMKADAVQFVNMFSEGRDTIGLITFGSSIYTGFRPSKSFKTVLAPNTDTLPNLINQIQCGGNTSSAMALNAAYNMIKTINQSGALNVILFFTDGYPNGVTGFYPIRTQSDTRYGYSGGYNPTRASPDGTYSTGTTVCGNKNSTCTMDPSPCKDTGGDMYDRNSGQTKRTVFGPPWNVNWNTNTIAVGTGAPAGTIRGVYAQWAGDLYDLSQGESNGLMKEAATSISQTS